MVYPPYQCRHGRRRNHLVYHCERILFSVEYDKVFDPNAPPLPLKFILSNVVCAWRAAVLWNYDRRIVAVLALFILGNIGKFFIRRTDGTPDRFSAAAGSELGLGLGPLFTPSHQSIQDTPDAKPDERTLILVGPTLATNVLSTVLIGIQAW